MVMNSETEQFGVLNNQEHLNIDEKKDQPVVQEPREKIFSFRSVQDPEQKIRNSC